jgi:hypothetical protein
VESSETFCGTDAAIGLDPELDLVPETKAEALGLFSERSDLAIEFAVDVNFPSSACHPVHRGDESLEGLDEPAPYDEVRECKKHDQRDQPVNRMHADRSAGEGSGHRPVPRPVM